MVSAFPDNFSMQCEHIVFYHTPFLEKGGQMFRKLRIAFRFSFYIYEDMVFSKYSVHCNLKLYNVQCILWSSMPCLTIKHFFFISSTGKSLYHYIVHVGVRIIIVTVSSFSRKFLCYRNVILGLILETFKLLYYLFPFEAELQKRP